MAEDDVVLSYRRRGEQVRVTALGDPNEMRQVLIGVWADFPPAVRLEFVAELAHYAKVLAYPDQFPDHYLSPLAETVRRALGKEVGVDLKAMKVAEFGKGAGDGA